MKLHLPKLTVRVPNYAWYFSPPTIICWPITYDVKTWLKNASNQISNQSFINRAWNTFLLRNLKCQQIFGWQKQFVQLSQDVFLSQRQKIIRHDRIVWLPLKGSSLTFSREIAVSCILDLQTKQQQFNKSEKEF